MNGREMQEYFEAAKVDGASSWKILRSITLPLTRPATGTVMILSLMKVGNAKNTK